METSHAMNGRQMDSEENSNIRMPTVKMERSAYSGGWNSPCMA
jgi:hypothetical protein